MAKLEWDKISDRTYETGLDRGVLYLPSAPGVYDDGVVWNGLIGVDEQFNDDLTDSFYFDGIKYLDSYQMGDFTATLRAYTYPDEFLEFEGVEELGSGLFVDDQASKVFGMSYRTRIGSEVSGLNAGYQIHLLYNLTVTEDTYTYQNESPEPSVLEFQWTIYGLPEKVDSYRPTAHVILDSRYLNSDILATIERILYGTDDKEYWILDGGTPASTGVGLVDGGSVTVVSTGTIDGNLREFMGHSNPRLPSLAELLDLVLNWQTKIIVPNETTGLAQLLDGLGDLTVTGVSGVYTSLPDTRLVQSEIAGLFTLDV